MRTATRAGSGGRERRLCTLLLRERLFRLTTPNSSAKVLLYVEKLKYLPVSPEGIVF